MVKKPGKKFDKKREPKEFEEEVIQIDRVTRVVKGGRRLRFRATVVIGDKKGRVGYGIGKSTEVQLAIQKAVTKAKKNLISIPIYEGTIPHTQQVKFKASKILIKPASQGTGVIAGGAVRKILDVAGVKNVLSKSLGSSNRVNNTKAAFLALSKLRERPELETDAQKAKHENVEDKAAPEIKTISRKEAKEREDADKRMTTSSKAKQAKAPVSAEAKSTKGSNQKTQSSKKTTKKATE
ncbi:30S ribosomal protein S5 [Patescibacteria group bacterium]|nr:30S ribosomal protein S5 [Patescibacteria group bacterium]